jgi:hypothetical protein
MTVSISALLLLSGAGRLLRVHTFGVGGFDRGFDRDSGAERDKPAEAAAAGDGSLRGGEPRATVETRTRGEAYADLRQAVESGWDRTGRYEAPRGELAAFRAERAGLPEVSSGDAVRYVERHRDTRPWLRAAERASPEALRIIAAADQGGGHGHIRHEGWVTEEASMRRVAYLEDPAQLDPGKRRSGIDGLDPAGHAHRCGTISTRFTSPDAFATAFARGAGHARVREALAQPFDPNRKPREVLVPIADLLGRDGYRHCTGWRLETAGGSMRSARADRDAWRAARAQGLPPCVPKPRATPVATFEGGSVRFAFGHDHDRGRYEIVTMFPRPRDSEPS